MSANPQPHPTRPEEYPPADTAHHWAKASKDLRHRLTQAIPHGVLKELHRKSPARHFAIAVRQFLLLAATSCVSWNFPQPWIWIPSALIAGWTAFNFTVLLHEVVHRAVWNGPRPRAERFLAHPLRGAVGNLRPSVHALAPDASRGARRRGGRPQTALPLSEDQQALVQAPLLHARALPDLLPRRAARDGELPAGAPEADRPRAPRDDRTSRRRDGGAVSAPPVSACSRASISSPYFLVFPIAFALNRLGQHYAIDPTDPAKWGTILKPSRFWDFWYLYSAYHLEHHYFTAVPLYNLRRLHFALRPFFDEIGWKPVTYRRLFRDWILREQGAAHRLAPEPRGLNPSGGATARARASVESSRLDDTDDLNRLIAELNYGRPDGRTCPRPSASDRWLAELARPRRQRSAAGRRRARRRFASTAPSRPLPEEPLSGEEIEDAVLPGPLAGAQRALSRRANRPTAPTRCAASAASASTCTASAAAPPRRCERCRPSRRASRRSACRPAPRP